MRSFSLVVGLMCLITTTLTTAHAKSADAFYKRFEVIRNADGTLVGVRDRTLPVKFSVKPYVSFIKNQIKSEQALMNSQNLADGSYEESVKNIVTEGLDQNFYGDQTEMDQNVQAVVDSLKKLAVLNVDEVFANDEFNNVVGQFEGKMTDAILMLDPTMVANASDSTFFYKKNVTYKAVSWALDFARKRLSSIPLLNTASYVVVQVENLITQRRQFHQNMLLHYLENFKAEELGLTHDEVNMIWSSIYESRIQWYAFWESNNAKTNWLTYGTNNFYSNFRAASATLRNSASIYTEVTERMNYAFQKVTYKNEKVVINLFDKESQFQNRPAVAYNYDKPTQVIRKRIILNLAELGLSFVPMNSSIKDAVSNFMKSFYAQQKITEGALYGYFESYGNTIGQSQVAAQYLNPFDALSL